MQGNRLVVAVLGVALSIGGMIATAGPAAAAPGPSIGTSAVSTCTDGDRVAIKVTVRNREFRSILVKVRAFGVERWSTVDGRESRTVQIRTDRRSVDAGSASVSARKVSGGDRTETRVRFDGKRCVGDPRIEVRPRDRNDNNRLDGVWVKNTSPFDIRVRVVIGSVQETRSLAPNQRWWVDSPRDNQPSGVAIATRRIDGKVYTTVKVFQA